MGAVISDPESSTGSALFGATRQAVLRMLFGRPDQRFYLRQIIRFANLGTGTVQRELAALTRAGILVRTDEGVQSYYQANAESPVFPELRGLIRKTFGMADVLRTALASLGERVQVAFLYGSMATGAEAAGSDIDVMVVGDNLTLGAVVSALSGAQRELGREVNPSVYPSAEFCSKLAAGHHFVSSVVAGPKVFLVGTKSELSRLAEVWLAQAAQDKPAGDRRPVRRRRS